MNKVFLLTASLTVLLFFSSYGGCPQSKMARSSLHEESFSLHPLSLIEARSALLSEYLTPLLEKTLDDLPRLDLSPQVFISYAWPKEPYKEQEQDLQPFLLTLVGHLKRAGIHALLDLLDLKPGSHINDFMSDGIFDSSTVLIMGTSTYSERAFQETNVKYDFERILQDPAKAVPLGYKGALSPSFTQTLDQKGVGRGWNLSTSESYYQVLPALISHIYQRAGIPAPSFTSYTMSIFK